MTQLDQTDNKLLAQLDSGETITGPEIGRRLAISRAAVWKRISRLRALGIAIDSIRGQGYRLTSPLMRLDRQWIETELANTGVVDWRSLLISDITDSTNLDIKALPAEEQHGVVALAEYQSAGRGRRGRHWVSPFAANCYLSIGWHFQQSPSELGCLSLAVGVMVKRALNGLGVSEIALKWPNDIRANGRKLGGCLIEIAGDQTGPADAIIGVGINVSMPEETEIGQPWINLHELNAGIGRNELAHALIRELCAGLSQFAATGFLPFAADWALFDELLDKDVQIIRDDGVVNGIARGISGQGGLILEIEGEMQEFHSGDVSLRGA